MKKLRRLKQAVMRARSIFSDTGSALATSVIVMLSRRVMNSILRPSHFLEPIKKIVVATDAIRKAAAQEAEDIMITVVPVVMSWTEGSELEDVLKFDHINLVTYDSGTGIVADIV